MRTAGELAELGLRALIEAGADHAACQASTSGKNELSAEAGEMSLLRTTHDISVDLTALRNGKKGSVRVGSADDEAIVTAAREAIGIADAGVEDDANGIAEFQPVARFYAGAESPDRERMYEMFSAFLAATGERFPKVVLTMAAVDFNHSHTASRNSNGVDFEAARGLYGFGAWFSAKDGGKVSSMNGSGISMPSLDRELMECGTLAGLMRQSEEQLDTIPLEGKFVGDIIITPDCLDDFIGMLTGTLSDESLIAGTSIHRDKMGEAIASPLFTLHSRPVSGEIAAGYSWTGDGYASRDLTIVEGGVLRNFLLSLYGSRKTGKALPTKSGGCWVVDAGTTPYAAMVKSVKRGILVNRFSGGHPGDNGDFSGVAKNSYLIEDGVIRHPISETMMSGNLSSLMKSINAISRERVDFGHSIFPWVATTGVTISGK